MRHFLDLDRIDPPVLRDIVEAGKRIKADPATYRVLNGETLALIFEKPSTRTRVSFEVGMRELGGEVTALTGAEMQLGQGETLGDTARVMSRFVHAMMVRTHETAKLIELADNATVPVINGLTNETHPCQVMADVMTIEERLGPIAGRTLAWVGDGQDNVLHSLIHASTAFGFDLRIAAPAELMPEPERLTPRVSVMADPAEACAGADAVFTDCWVSMHNSDARRRQELLAPYQVNARLMSLARPHAPFLHCLPAHRGEEVTSEVLDGPRSAVWDEAENRKHVQKAIILWCLGRM